MFSLRRSIGSVLLLLLLASTALASEARQVRDLLMLAQASTNYQQRDELILRGAASFNETDSFLTLASGAVYETTKVALLRMGSRFLRNVPDCIRLAKASQNCQVRDELLLLGIPFCQSASDATTLVSKAAYESTKKRILDEYSRCARFSTIHSSRSQEGLEEQLDGLLDLPVGVENYACARITNEAHGEAAGQFAAPRLIEQAASQSGPHSVQFRLAHRALEAQ